MNFFELHSHGNYLRKIRLFRNCYLEYSGRSFVSNINIIGKMKKHIKETGLLFASSLFLSFTVCLFAPVSIILSNIDEFWFNLYHIAGLLLCTFLVTWVLTAAIGVVLYRFCPKWLFFIYETLLLAGSICVYVHSNFLNLKVGTLDGGNVDWDSFKVSMIVNLLWWIGIIAAVFLIRIFLKKHIDKYIKYLPALLTFLEAVALVTLLITNAAEGKTIWNKDIKILSDKDICELSDEDNILIFVLDMFDVTSMRQIMDGGLMCAVC